MKSKSQKIKLNHKKPNHKKPNHKTPNSTREGFGHALLELGETNKNVVALSADLTESTQAHHFAKKYPQQFFQSGVAEQNMIGMATGLALEGKIPFATSFGVFLPMRCLDQIRVSVCYNQANVKLVATHCGLLTGQDGATHQALEDVAVLRSIPNLTIIEPCDYRQATQATKAVAKHQGPVYLRLHRAKFKNISKGTFKIGQADILQSGKKLTVIGSGPVLHEVMVSTQGKDVEIINCHTVSPLDTKTILKSAKKTKRVLVIQDHQVTGGLGSAVTELLSAKLPTKCEIIGMQNKFGESGTPTELWDKYGLSAKKIGKKIEKIMR